MTTLSDVIKAQAKEAVLEAVIALLRLANFPTASWQSFSLPVHLTDAFASLWADATTLIADIAASGFMGHAKGAWLDLIAASKYNETRKPALATQGRFTLADVASSGPHAYAAGAFWIGVAGGELRFKNVDPVAIGVAGGTQSVLFEAESPGADWNIGVGTSLDVRSPGGTGIQVTNPALEAGTWITRQGVDDEKDEAFVQRCYDKWGTIGSGSNDAAYRYWCTSTSSEVTSVKVVADPSTGAISSVVSGPLGPISSAALAAVQAVVEAKGPLCISATVANCIAQTTPVAGTIYLTAGAVAADVLAGVQTAITDYATTVDIGGVVYVAELVAAAMGVAGVRNVTFSLPAADVYLGADRKFVPSFSVGTSA